MSSARSADHLFRAYLVCVALVATFTYVALRTAVDASIGGGFGLILLLIAGFPWSIAYALAGESEGGAVAILAASAALNGYLVRYRPALLP